MLSSESSKNRSSDPQPEVEEQQKFKTKTNTLFLIIVFNLKIHSVKGSILYPKNILVKSRSETVKKHLVKAIHTEVMPLKCLPHKFKRSSQIFEN